MIHATMLMEDNFIVATRGVGIWDLRISDIPTGMSETFQITDDVMGALMSLMFAGDTLPSEVSDQLYKIVGTLFDNSPMELRIIP